MIEMVMATMILATYSGGVLLDNVTAPPGYNCYKRHDEKEIHCQVCRFYTNETICTQVKTPPGVKVKRR